jgi:hypothetical protein
VRRVTVARSAAAVIFANRSNARMNDRLAKRKPFERAPLLRRAVYRYSGQHSNGKLPNSGIIAEAARISPNLKGAASGTGGSPSWSIIWSLI